MTPLLSKEGLTGPLGASGCVVFPTWQTPAGFAFTWTPRGDEDGELLSVSLLFPPHGYRVAGWEPGRVGDKDLMNTYEKRRRKPLSSVVPGPPPVSGCWESFRRPRRGSSSWDIGLRDMSLPVFAAAGGWSTSLTHHLSVLSIAFVFVIHI